MKVHNLRKAAVLVVIYGNGRAGIVKMVMRDTPEELFGPAFMKGPDGKDIYMTVLGEIFVADLGASNAENLICVDHAPVSKNWIGADGVSYRLVACDYRYRPPERQSR